MLWVTQEWLAQPIFCSEDLRWESNSIFFSLQNLLERWEQDIQDMTANEVSLLKSYFELTEFHYVLTYIGPLLGDSEIRKETLLSR